MWASASARHAFRIDDTYVSNASFRRQVREPRLARTNHPFVELVFREMPRYFFHFKRGQVTLLDQEGVELADIEQAVKRSRPVRAKRLYRKTFSKEFRRTVGRSSLPMKDGIQWSNLPF